VGKRHKMNSKEIIEKVMNLEELKQKIKGEGK